MEQENLNHLQEIEKIDIVEKGLSLNTKNK